MTNAQVLENLQNFIQGNTVTILAGSDSEKRSLLVHQRVLSAADSPSLRMLVDGKWAESKSRVIDWSHTDADTVMRLLTYLYVGDYNVPPPRRLEQATRSAISSNDPESDMEKYHIQPEATKTEGNTNEPLPDTEAPTNNEVSEPRDVTEQYAWAANDEQFKTQDPALQNTFLRSVSAWPLTPSTAGNRRLENETGIVSMGTKYPYAKHSYKEVLLGHAKLYAFAKYHMCESLLSLILSNIRQILSFVDCTCKHAAAEVASLATFAYEHVCFSNGEEDALRNIVSHFVVANFASLVQNDLETLLMLGGDLTLDVIGKLSQRLRGEKQFTENLLQQNVELKRRISNINSKQAKAKADMQLAKEHLQALAGFNA